MSASLHTTKTNGEKQVKKGCTTAVSNGERERERERKRLCHAQNTRHGLVLFLPRGSVGYSLVPQMMARVTGSKLLVWLAALEAGWQPSSVMFMLEKPALDLDLDLT